MTDRQAETSPHHGCKMLEFIHMNINFTESSQNEGELQDNTKCGN